MRESIVNSFSTVSKEKIFEYFICLTTPRKDVRLLAKSILEKVGGSFTVLFNKDEKYLKNVLELQDTIIAAIMMFKKMMTIYNDEELSKDNSFDTIKAIAKYFQREIGSSDTEFMVVLFLNPAKQLIEKKVYGDKNNSITSFNVSDVINIALNNNAKYLILSHNHPSGNTKPSDGDKKTTAIFEETIKNIDKFELIDHIIVSTDKYYSFRENNQLKNVFKTILGVKDSNKSEVKFENKK